MPAKPKINMFELGSEFNDKVMREFGLDVEDHGYIYWADNSEIVMIKDKYIKYCEVENPILEHNEIELNLLENARLMETLTYVFLKKTIRNEIVSISQDIIKGSDKGHFVLAYMKGDKVEHMESDPFINDSVRVFNLICKINKTTNLYNFHKYDVPIKRDYSK